MLNKFSDQLIEVKQGLWLTGIFCGYQHFSDDFYENLKEELEF